MVSFTCENCGDTLREDVAQHVGECKGPFPLTCIHCKEEFYDDLYTSHSICASEIREAKVKVRETKSSPMVEAEPSSKAEITPSEKLETTPLVKVKEKPHWIHAIEKVSQSPSLTTRQSSLLATIANLNNVPKKREAFRKYVLTHWKGSGAIVDVIEEVYLLIQAQTMNVPVHSLTTKAPSWVAAMRATCQGKRKPPPYSKIVIKVLGFQVNNPVPLSLPNQQSFQNLVRAAYNDSNIDVNLVNELFDAILMKMADNINPDRPHGTATVTSVDGKEEDKRPAPVTSVKKKRDKKRSQEAVQTAEVETESAVEEISEKKSKKKKHKRQDEDFLENENVPKKKSSRGA